MSTSCGWTSRGNAVADASTPASKKRSSAATSGETRSGLAGGLCPASTKPQLPKLGTSTWYGTTARPAAFTVRTTDQYAAGAKYGEPACTTSRPPGASTRFASP